MIRQEILRERKFILIAYHTGKIPRSFFLSVSQGRFQTVAAVLFGFGR